MSTPSLLNIPYVIKAGTLYSQIPETGAGDFVVSRTTSPATNRSTRVNANGFIETVADNVPRLDYPRGGAVNGCASLLVEPSAINLVPNGLGYTSSVGVVYDTTITDSPAVGINSTRITKNEAAGTIRYGNQECSNSALSANTTYTISRFFKYDGVDFETRIEANSAAQFGGTAWSQRINIASTGITLGISTACTGSIQNYGNGWYRVAVTIVTGATISGGTPVSYLMRFPAALSTGQGMLTALPQLEVGSFATSYIPTTTQAINRGDEVVKKTGITSLIGQSEGTVYLEMDIQRIGGTNWLVFAIQANTNTDYIYVTLRTGGQIRLTLKKGGGSNFDAITTSANTVGIYKIAIAYKNGDYEIYINGISRGTSSDTSNFPNSLTQVFLSDVAAVYRSMNNRLRAFAIYPNRLSNSELQALTTP